MMLVHPGSIVEVRREHVLAFGFGFVAKLLVRPAV
jgi:hypothetical protein